MYFTSWRPGELEDVITTLNARCHHRVAAENFQACMKEIKESSWFNFGEHVTSINNVGRGWRHVWYIWSCLHGTLSAGDEDLWTSSQITLVSNQQNYRHTIGSLWELNSFDLCQKTVIFTTYKNQNFLKKEINKNCKHTRSSVGSSSAGTVA